MNLTTVHETKARGGKGMNNEQCMARTTLVRLGRSAAALAILAATAGAGAVLDADLAANAKAQDNSIVSVGQGDALQRVDLGLNKSLVIDLPEDASDILVANPAVADAVSRSARRIYIFGRSVGDTNIFVFGQDGRPVANIDLNVERDVSGLEIDLERFVPGSDIEVEIVNDNIVLSGTVLTAQDANRAQQLASAFLNGGEQGSRGQQAATAEGGDGGGDGDVVLGVDQSSSIVNLITVLGEDQVTLKLTIAEVQRSILKQLGVNISGSIETSALNNDLIRGLSGGMNSLVPGFVNSAPGNSFGVGSSQGLLGGNNFSFGGTIGPDDFNIGLQGIVKLMNDTGVMRTLAEPTLTAISGEEASFRVGGDYNIVGGVDFDSQSGGFTVESRQIEYGVSLAFKPIVLSSGRISIKMRTEVAEPTAVGSNPGANTTVLSLRKREAETTVELPSGGTMMIAGLIRDDVRQTISKTPGLSNVPIFGSLFRSRAFAREETELVILATPYLVRPVPRAKMARPDDNFHPANDTQGYLLGRVNKIYGNRKKPQGQFHGAIGFIYK